MAKTYEVPGGKLVVTEGKNNERLTTYEGTPYAPVRLKRKYTRGKSYKGVR